MLRILEELYLTRLSLIDEQKEHTEYCTAKLEFDKAYDKLKRMLDQDQAHLLFDLRTAQENLNNQEAACAFASGYRLRELLNAALI